MRVAAITRFRQISAASIFSPHHLIDHTGVTLDNLYHLVGHVLVHIVRHGDAQVTVSVPLLAKPVFRIWANIAVAAAPAYIIQMRRSLL